MMPMGSGGTDCHAEKEDCCTETAVSMMDTFQREFLMEKVALSVRKAGIMKVNFPRNKPKVMERLCSKNVDTDTKENGQETILMVQVGRSGQKEAR